MTLEPDPINISPLPSGQMLISLLQGSGVAVQGENTASEFWDAVIIPHCSSPATQPSSSCTFRPCSSDSAHFLNTFPTHTPCNDRLLLQTTSGLCLPESFFNTSSLQIPVVAKPSLMRSESQPWVAIGVFSPNPRSLYPLSLSLAIIATLLYMLLLWGPFQAFFHS